MKHSFAPQYNQNSDLMNSSKQTNKNEQTRNKYKYEYVFSNENKSQNSNQNNPNRVKTQTSQYKHIKISSIKQHESNSKKTQHSKSISSCHGASVHSEHPKLPRNSYQDLKKSHIQDFQRRIKKNTHSQRAHSYNKSVSTNYQPEHKKLRPIQKIPSDIHKAQSQILQSQKVLSNQKFQIEALTQELTFYLKTCQVNKRQIEIQNNRKQCISKQYEQKIRLLISEKDHLSQMLDNFSHQTKQKTENQQNQISMKRQINQQIGKSIEQLLDKKQSLLTKIRQADLQAKYLQQNILAQQQQKLDELRNIERKFNIALKQLQRLQKKKLNK